MGLSGGFPPSAISVVGASEHEIPYQQESTEDLLAPEAVIAAEIAGIVEFFNNNNELWEELTDGLAAAGSYLPEELANLSLPDYLVDHLRELRELLLTFGDPCEPDGARQWITGLMAHGSPMEEALSISLELCDLITTMGLIDAL